MSDCDARCCDGSPGAEPTLVLSPGSRGVEGGVNHWPHVNPFCESAFLMCSFHVVSVDVPFIQKYNVRAMWRGQEQGTAPGEGLQLETVFTCIAH